MAGGSRRRFPWRGAALGLLFFAGTGWATLHTFRAEPPRPAAFAPKEAQHQVVASPIVALSVRVGPRVEVVLETTPPAPLLPR